jgi:hypothetical protein
MASVFLFKEIKAKRLKDPDLMKDVRRVVDVYRKRVRADFEKTTKTWDRKPRFQEQRDTTSQHIGFVVWTDDQTYRWVNEGTDPHGISPVLSDYLSLAPYVHKTVPGVIGSRAGGRLPSNRVYGSVWHPGMDARNFDDAIRSKHEQQFKKDLQQALARATRRNAG